LIIIFAVLLLVGIGGGTYFVFGNYSKGYRTGTVMKLSKKGAIFKTWEGQLNVGGLQDADGDGMSTTVWDFSVRDERVIGDIEAAVDHGKRVKLRYNEKFYKLDYFGDTKYFVYAVEEVDDIK
ncbi:MAG: hypothetical protein AAF738_09420, partial [Bacteroidota bacterium]